MPVYAVNIADVFEPARKINSPAKLISLILPNLYLLAGIIVFLLIVLGGFFIIQGASSGDSSDTERGKKAVTYAIIGLIIIFGSYFFIQFIEKLVGVEII